MNLNVTTIKQEKYQVGFPDYDVPGKFFEDVINEKGYTKKDKNTFIEIKQYEQTDNVLHMMVIDNRLKASVIERRSEFNDLEYTMCAWD
jgi:hypothetical protein